MKIQTLSKIVNAVVLWSVQYNDSCMLAKISTSDYIPCASTVSTLHNCIYVIGDYNDLVITLLDTANIGIYRVERENHLCIGYKPMYCIDTTKKTQVEITAELMYCVNSKIITRK